MNYSVYLFKVAYHTENYCLAYLSRPTCDFVLGVSADIAYVIRFSRISTTIVAHYTSYNIVSACLLYTSRCV